MLSGLGRVLNVLDRTVGPLSKASDVMLHKYSSFIFPDIFLT